jgi:hypothetical protein
MVMSIARLRGSLLEAPMAHALPPEARRISDVVAAALDDIDGWPVSAPDAPAPPAETAAQPETAAARQDVRPLWVVAFVAVVLVVGILAAAAWRLRRRD